MKVNNTGLYIRLSREDDEGVVSESIVNQKSLLLQYVKENNLSVYDIYIDDGYSGTNYDRPAFKRLISDIELGKITIVITKDMSRLGRDYITTGELIEKYFPIHNIRYIAVTDNIDTFLDIPSNDIAPFKAIMNDMYAKDISKKIRSSLITKKKEGKWVAGRVPYGYMKDPQDKNHLIIDEKQSIIVKEIFSLANHGLSYYQIAKKLTFNKVKTPAEYYNYNFKIYYGRWSSKTIKDILTNQVYIGNLVQNKSNKVNYKINKIVKNEEKDYIIVENTHRAIITKELFYDTLKILPKNEGRSIRKENHLLDGLLYCGDCFHKIMVQPRRKNNRCYTLCSYYRKKACTTHSNNYDVLEKIIIDKIRNIVLNKMDKNKIKKLVLRKIRNNENDVKREKDKLREEILKLENNLDRVYYDKVIGLVDDSQYLRIRDRINKEINSRKKDYLSLNNNRNYSDIGKDIDEFLKFKTIDRELVIRLIDKIYIYQNKNVNIIVNF